MKQVAENLVNSVKSVIQDKGLSDKAGAMMDALQTRAPWAVKAAAHLPLAPRLLGPLMVLSRYRKGGKVTVPEKGLSADTLFGMLDFYQSFDMPSGTGHVFAYYYDAGRAVNEVQHKAYLKFLKSNPLDPTVTPSVVAMENELVEMSKAHVNAGPDVVGNFTSGGTESIMLAVKTARNWARKNRPHITEPEMILPETAHAAFYKAADYLSIKIVQTPVDKATFRADPQAMREAVGDNTILLVASAPSYAHGVVDPIREIGEIAVDHDLLFHVDACVGGFALHYFRRLGVEVPDYDFSVPGVSTMSMDIHKYGFASKGASIVLHRDAALRHYQYFACSGWTGYCVVNQAVQSSRSGGPVAAAWATMNFLGQAGYLRLAKQMLDGTRHFIEAMERFPDLSVMGNPHMNLVAVSSDTLSVFNLADEMKKRGWFIQPQFGHREHRENVHFSIQANNVPKLDAMLSDLREAVEAAKRIPPSAVAKRLIERVIDREPEEIDDEAFWELMHEAGIEGQDVPERMAVVNEVLNALPTRLTDNFLTRYFNAINRFAVD